MKLDNIEQDEFLKSILAKEQTPVLPNDFTVKLMAKLELAAARKARIYEPLISRQVWRRIIIAISSLFILQLIFVFAGLVTWPDLRNFNLFGLQPTSMPSAFFLNNYLAYLPKLLVVVGACLALWLWEIMQKYTSHRHNSF